MSGSFGRLRILNQEVPMSRLITYKIVSDIDGRLKASARTACYFWNRFLRPRASVVVRIGSFRSVSAVIARAY